MVQKAVVQPDKRDKRRSDGLRRELHLIRAAVQFEHGDDSLLTTETDVVLQVDDSLICLIPPSSWKRSPMGGFGFA